MSRSGQDGWDEEDAAARLFVLTGGRSRPAYDVRGTFGLITLIATERPASAGMQAEHAKILRLCQTPQIVTEIAAHMGLPVGAVKIFLADLLASGHISVHQPHPPARTGQISPGQPEPELLKAVIHGLQQRL